ncbi:lecithin retinol acyltransferase family protein [Pseudomonas putida]|uniref:lecithin retinol acyltransferase family protein n=1 Tax=Pseudomonas putida TaxID=303 RepID=UPI00345D8767
MGLLRDLWRIANGTDPYLNPIPKTKPRNNALPRPYQTGDLPDHKIPFISSFIDNVLATTVTPVPGSVVYCGLAFNALEHSGIYIGGGKIVHLEGSGKITAVSRAKFLERLDGYNVAITVYVSCSDGKAVGSKAVAERAKALIGKTVDYRLLQNNCHRFSSNCLGEDSMASVTLTGLKASTVARLGCDSWLAWTLPSSNRK